MSNTVTREASNPQNAGEPKMLVATLMANPAHPCLDESLIARACTALGAKSVLLAEGIAVDLMVSRVESTQTLRQTLMDLLHGLPVDLAVQAQGGRRKKLLIADMDSTFIEQECIDELADYAGLKAEVSGITERAMRGEIAFEPALRERVALLKGLPITSVMEVIQNRITLMPGGPALVRTMKANGAYTALVSGGFTVFTGPISQKIGFDMHQSNHLEIEGDQFAGSVRAPILGKEAKRATLIQLREQHGLAADETLAVGDGANDLAMLQEAGLGVAFHAKPIVAEAAHVRLDHADLTGLLYVQGYRTEDFFS
jgi:phosphoserine phosphatase